jgi:uncharacterized membrane protein
MTLASIKHYLLQEKHIHLFFVVSLWVKAVDAVIEIAGGIGAFFVSQQFLVNLALWVFKNEFAEDPHDIVANTVLHAVEHLSVGFQIFAAAYLLAHGAIKLWLVIGLLRERLWYYPVALVVFALFILYQLYRFTITGSVWMVVLTILDLIVIALTWHEWRYLRSRKVYA